MWGESPPAPDVARVQRVHRQKKGTNPCPFVYVRTSTAFGGSDQRLRLDRDRARRRLLLFLDPVLLFLDRLLLFLDPVPPFLDPLLLFLDRLLLFLDRLLLFLDRLLLFRARLLVARFRVELPPARRFRVAAAFRAEADRADLLRRAEARPPRRPPFFVGALLVFRPRPEPDLRPPPDIAFSVAQARRSASSCETPRRS